MTKSQGFGAKAFKAEEPNRPIFSGGDVNNQQNNGRFNNNFQTPANNGTE